MFNSQKATQLSRVTVYKLFRGSPARPGFRETLQHPHVLKHTAAMLMVRQGANAFLIRQHLGHSSFDSTLAYVNPSTPTLRPPVLRHSARRFDSYKVRVCYILAFLPFQTGENARLIFSSKNATLLLGVETTHFNSNALSALLHFVHESPSLPFRQFSGPIRINKIVRSGFTPT